MDSMDDVRKFLNKPEEYHPLPNGKFTDGFGNMLDAHSVVYAITAERDRLAAENKQLAIDYELSVKSRNWQYDAHIDCKNELAAANATLDRLREAIRRQHAELFYVTAAQESLAETPDVPAQGIDRGEQLTGACSATIQADGPCR